VPIGQDGFIEASRSEIRVHWTRGDMVIDLTLLSEGPTTFTAMTRTAQMKRLARKVDAAL